MFLKRCCFVILCIIICSLLFGCNKVIDGEEQEEIAPEMIKEVSMDTEYQIYEEDVLRIRVRWYNQLLDSITFGEMFYLEKNVDGKWKQVTKKTNINYAFNSIGYLLDSYDSRWHTYNLIPYTDGLPHGEYRISTTIHRNAIEGVTYGAGNNPSYQVYGYFQVGDERKKRDIPLLDSSKIEYTNEDFGFSLLLPKEWEGFEVIKEDGTGDIDTDNLFRKIDKNFKVIKVRHPQWDIEDPYQDISLVFFQIERWNNNINAAINDNFNLLPHIVLGNHEYVITLDPIAYKETFRGYQEVMEIIGSDYSNTSIKEY